MSSQEILNEAHALKAQHGRAPAEVFQLAFATANTQYLVKDSGGKSGGGLLQENESELKRVITSYGGAKLVDDWLKKNDSQHQRLQNLKGIDWSFLPENLRP